jgi:hypothetical protein
VNSSASSSERAVLVDRPRCLRDDPVEAVLTPVPGTSAAVRARRHQLPPFDEPARPDRIRRMRFTRNLTAVRPVETTDRIATRHTRPHRRRSSCRQTAPYAWERQYVSVVIVVATVPNAFDLHSGHPAGLVDGASRDRHEPSGSRRQSGFTAGTLPREWFPRSSAADDVAR